MLKSIEMQGKTEEEAIERAIAQLGLTRDEVSVEVLEIAKPGLFGIKNTPAIVKVEYESDDVEGDIELTRTQSKIATPEPAMVRPTTKDVPATTKKTPAATKKSATNPKTSPTDAKMPPNVETEAVDADFAEKIDTYLKGLFERMDLDVSFVVSKKDTSFDVTLKSADPGALIGRRGEALDALQHLTNYSVNRSSSGYAKIRLDAENYRKRRSEALENLAVRTASKVVQYRRNMTLDPMNAFERHVVHTALQNNDQVSTFSVGNESNRRVVIAYGKDEKAQSHTDSPQYKEWH